MNLVSITSIWEHRIPIRERTFWQHDMFSAWTWDYHTGNTRFSAFDVRRPPEAGSFPHQLCTSILSSCLPDFLTVQQQVILPSGTVRLIFAPDWFREDWKLRDQEGKIKGKGKIRRPLAYRTGAEALGAPMGRCGPCEERRGFLFFDY